jgi:hypothetical protein
MKKRNMFLIVVSYLTLMYFYLLSFPPDQRLFKIYWTVLLSIPLLSPLVLFLYLLSRDDDKVWG